MKKTLVLIESDWNLKEDYTNDLNNKLTQVLIESDWNLKKTRPQYCSQENRINRIRLEFKAEYY